MGTTNLSVPWPVRQRRGRAGGAAIRDRLAALGVSALATYRGPCLLTGHQFVRVISRSAGIG